MQRRSLTILELLIALALVLAMAAIVAPSLLESLDERAFEAAADETNEQLLMARAHAQQTGKPVEVTYHAEKSQVQARVFAPGESDDSSHATSSLTVEEPWAVRFLGPGVRIMARSPYQPDSSEHPADQQVPLDDEDFESLADLGKGQDVRLAVFMPDGTALMADRVWLNDSKGRLGVFTINQWSGLPFFERLADLTRRAAESKPESKPSSPPADR